MWLSLATLTALEIVLGTQPGARRDPTERVPPDAARSRARSVWPALARLVLLAMLRIVTLTEPLFCSRPCPVVARPQPPRGAFPLAKATHEIHNEVERTCDEKSGHSHLRAVVTQIAFIRHHLPARFRDHLGGHG